MIRVHTMQITSGAVRDVFHRWCPHRGAASPRARQNQRWSGEVPVNRTAGLVMSASRYAWLTIEDIAEELGVSIHSVRKWFAAGWRSGRCPRFIRPGRRILVRRDWFDEWCEDQAASA